VQHHLRQAHIEKIITALELQTKLGFDSRQRLWPTGSLLFELSVQHSPVTSTT
jgi:hypothetical protein